MRIKRTLVSALCLVLAAALLFGACGSASANAEKKLEEVANASYFTEQEHADVDYSDMTAPTDYDDAEFLSRLEHLRELLAQEGKWEEIKAEYTWLYGQLEDISTWYNLNSIAMYRSGGEAEYSDACELFDNFLVEKGDALESVLCELMKTQYADSFTQLVGDYAAGQIASYQPLTDEQKELQQQETALVMQYHNVQNKEYTYSYGGTDWTLETLTAAAGERLSQEEWSNVFHELLKAQNEEHGGLYVQLVKVRAQIARLKGYDTYTDYAYQEIYHRDYTPEDACKFEENIKKEWGPLYNNDIAHLELINAQAEADSTEFGEKDILALLDAYIPQVSQEMAKALSYMEQYHLHALMDPDSDALSAGFTTGLDAYNEPFLYDRISGVKSDVSGAVHEFGHFSNSFFYNAPSNLIESKDSYDIDEVHSQGLEVLFAALFNDEIYGDDADIMTARALSSLMSVVVDGCLFDEFQQRIYENPEMTLEEMNALFYDLATQYGQAAWDETYLSTYWMFVPHNFDAPVYYISYATSALTTLDLWSVAHEDGAAGVQEYLKFSAYGSHLGYLELLEKCGMGNFTDEKYVTGISRQVTDWLDKADQNNQLKNKAADKQAA